MALRPVLRSVFLPRKEAGPRFGVATDMRGRGSLPPAVKERYRLARGSGLQRLGDGLNGRCSPLGEPDEPRDEVRAADLGALKRSVRAFAGPVDDDRRTERLHREQTA